MRKGCALVQGEFKFKDQGSGKGAKFSLVKSINKHFFQLLSWDEQFSLPFMRQTNGNLEVMCLALS